jgi:SAM-dependent methyltransferase
MTTTDETQATAVFDQLYRDSRDPWGTTTHWYERRKRALLLASLPRERYGSVYEAGCGTGHITAELSARATHVVASDASSRALAVARVAIGAAANVSLERHRLPDDWPDRPFDLIVLSEIVYFVDDDDCERIARAAHASAGASGTVVACDWRLPIAGYGHDGEEAHRRFEKALALPRLFEYLDRDFVLSGWSRDSSSVASRDGLR